MSTCDLDWCWRLCMKLTWINDTTHQLSASVWKWLLFFWSYTPSFAIWWTTGLRVSNSLSVFGFRFWQKNFHRNSSSALARHQLCMDFEFVIVVNLQHIYETKKCCRTHLESGKCVVQLRFVAKAECDDIKVGPMRWVGCHKKLLIRKTPPVVGWPSEAQELSARTPSVNKETTSRAASATTFNSLVE